jgi:hypothetical protein
VASAAEWHDAGVVDHLIQDDDVSGSLKNLDVVVVVARRHRRSRIEPDDTALRKASVLRPVDPTTRRLARGEPGARIGCERWNPAVGRIDDQ